MTAKFNQEFYAWIKAKKNEPLSSIGKRRLRVVEKGKEKEVTEKGSSTPALDEGCVTSSALSVEEISPHTKKCKTSDKCKEKMGANVWADAETALARANEVVMATSKVEALEAEASGLRKDLIVAMDINNSSKEKIKALTKELNAEKHLVKQRKEQLAVANQKMKSAIAKAVHAFQLMEEYSAILFGWNCKVFKLLRRYLVKHGLETDLEDLDFEAIDKEIEADKAVQAAQATASVGEDPPVPEKGGNDAPKA